MTAGGRSQAHTWRLINSRLRVEVVTPPFVSGSPSEELISSPWSLPAASKHSLFLNILSLNKDFSSRRNSNKHKNGSRRGVEEKGVEVVRKIFSVMRYCKYVGYSGDIVWEKTGQLGAQYLGESNLKLFALHYLGTVFFLLEYSIELSLRSESCNKYLENSGRIPPTFQTQFSQTFLYVTNPST